MLLFSIVSLSSLQAQDQVIISISLRGKMIIHHQLMVVSNEDERAREMLTFAYLGGRIPELGTVLSTATTNSLRIFTGAIERLRIR